MKLFFALILSFFVLAEAVFPCCLWDNCGQEEHVASQQKDEKEKGGCSPFATCSTCFCAVLSFKPDALSFKAPSLFVTHTPALYNDILSTYHDSLFQPPRLA